MLTSSYLYSCAARDLFNVQIACMSNIVRAVMDGHISASERHVDAIRTLLATATVATRQWTNASTANRWLPPASPRDTDSGPVPAAPPHGARTEALPNAGTATGTSLE